MAASSIDDASLDLIVQLQMQDIEALTAGEHRPGEVPDRQIAMGIYRTELQQLKDDRSMCENALNGADSDDENDFMAHAFFRTDVVSRDPGQTLDNTDKPPIVEAPAPGEDAGEPVSKVPLAVEEEVDLYSAPGQEQPPREVNKKRRFSAVASPSDDSAKEITSASEGSTSSLGTDSNDQMSRERSTNGCVETDEMDAYYASNGGSSSRGGSLEGVRKKLGSAIRGEQSEPVSGKEKSDSTTLAKQSQTRSTKRRCIRRQCVACTEWSTDAARCPCSHEYCRECLEVLFTNAIKDERDHPPRCCKQPIPVEPMQTLLPAQLLKDYQAKDIEYATPNRTYCHQPTCSIFVPLDRIQGSIATCPKCPSQICTDCKNALHPGNPCPPDAATQELLRVAREEGWQQCPNCHRAVELTSGCYHMTCLCKTEFCYLCKVLMPNKTKNCNCPVWDENRLRDAAQERVERDLAHQAQQREQQNQWAVQVQAVERAARIQVEVALLRDNHECHHENWKRLKGSHQCDECDDHLPWFIYECQQCRILACRHCRYHRL